MAKGSHHHKHPYGYRHWHAVSKKGNHRCIAHTKKGFRCHHYAKDASGYCATHVARYVKAY